MVDYYGRELKIGDLVLCLPTKQKDFNFSDSRLGLLIGKAEIFKVDKKNKSGMVYVFDKDILISLCPVNTPDLINKYKYLKKIYDEYMLNDIKSNHLISSLKPGDIVLRNIALTQKYVYLGYGACSITYDYGTSYQKGYLYLNLGSFLYSTDGKVQDVEYSFIDALNYIYDKYSNNDGKLDKRYLYLSETPLMIKEVKGRIKVVDIDKIFEWENLYRYSTVKSVKFNLLKNN